MSTTKKTARLAGLLFLMMVVFGLLAEVMFRQKLFVANDVVLTANNIISNTFLYRAGIISDMLMALCYLLTALALYKLLSPVDKNMASLMVVFAAAGSVLLMFNILIELAPLYILSGSAYLSDFSLNQQQALAMFFYNLYQHGYMIGQIFFALTAVVVHFLVPNATLETVFMLPMMVAEFSFKFYLLIRGVNEGRLVQQLSDVIHVNESNKLSV